MTALLTAESRGTTGPAKNEKIAQAIAECKRLNLTVLPPNINKSGRDFTIEEKTMTRFGLSAIKNVGEAAILNILENRDKGEFKSFEDFCKRVNLSTINKKTIESLIKAGAMDIFGNRAQLLSNYSEIIENVNRVKKNKLEGQSSLFGEEVEQEVRSTNQIVDDFSPNEKLGFEKEFLGFYLTSHPQMANLIAVKSLTSHDISQLEEVVEGKFVTVGGIIETTRKIFTKKTGAEMAFITISDEKGVTIEVVVFPKIYDRHKSLIVTDGLVIVEGKVDTKNDRPVILAEKLSTMKYSPS